MKLVFTVIIGLMIFNQATAQSTLSQVELYTTIARLDSSLFATLYTCNPETNKQFFTDDIEFYHDKGGAIYSLQSLMDALNKNFCTPHDYYTRRELVPGTMKVFAMNNYGAVQTGEHYFYERYKNEKEKLAGIAKFTNLWMLKDGIWKISRVISYDHQPAGEK